MTINKASVKAHIRISRNLRVNLRARIENIDGEIPGTYVKDVQAYLESCNIKVSNTQIYNTRRLTNSFFHPDIVKAIEVVTDAFMDTHDIKLPDPENIMRKGNV
jgi:hypothetical protein